MNNQNDLISALCVAGHHSGLPSLGTLQNKESMSTFFGRMKKIIPDASAYQKEIDLSAPQPEDFKNLPLRDNFSVAFFIRMLFSCLVDADSLDTEAYMEYQKPVEIAPNSVGKLYAKLQQYLQKEKGNNWNQDKKIQQVRAEVLEACQSKADVAPGIFTLSAPTGSGKTISSLAFALKHAKKFKKDRIIYVVPYRAIIDQTVSIFRKILGRGKVLAHYSGAEDYDEDGDEIKRLAAENWDKPVIVTTAVQFFESLFANKKGKCRKIHNIVNSVVIFDEGQSLPLACLQSCMAAVKELVHSYKVTALFMSATQPNFHQLLLNGKQEPLERTEIIPDIKKLTENLKRVAFSNLGEVKVKNLGGKLKRHKQVLCIVNTRKNGAALLKEIGHTEDTYLLTTYMKPVDRQLILAEIENKLKNDKPCRVISTSLIEAGIDIDFPTVYREECGLDSLIQAAGRCNREYNLQLGSVYFFSVAEFESVKIFSKNIAAMRIALADNLVVDDPQTIGRYFSALYNFNNNPDIVLPLFHEGQDELHLPFKEIANKFKLIENKELTVYIPCMENKDLLAALRRGTTNRTILRKLGRYGASVSEYDLNKITIEKVNENIYILANDKQYDGCVGCVNNFV